MNIKVNRKLVPVKAHFFFFFAALGPILPQLNVYGRQLGVSPGVMGLVTAVLPLLWAAAKPLFGYVVDFWPNQRKLVFMLLILVMTGSYCGLWFIPMPEEETRAGTTEPPILEYVYKMNDTVYLEQYDETNSVFVEKYTCHWNCAKNHTFHVYLTNSTYINTIYLDNAKNISCSLLHMDLDSVSEGEVKCIPKENCDLLCFEEELFNNTLNRTKRAMDAINVDNSVKSDGNTKIIDSTKVDSSQNGKKYDVNEVFSINKETSITSEDKSTSGQITTTSDQNTTTSGQNTTTSDQNTSTSEVTSIETVKSVNVSKEGLSENDIRSKISKVVHSTVEEESGSFYMTAAFWSFVVLMCIGTVAFNVANCIGDAVCFDVLGAENGSKYGSQRAWGTAGYGVTALLGGWLVDRISAGTVKNFAPAFLLALGATAVDLYSCTHLKLPRLSSPEDSGKALGAVLRIPRVVVFIVFAVVAGTFDSFIVYYMFWFLEELAEETGHMAQIKLIEGVVVAGQSFVGELLFFALSGKIIKRWGYGTTMTLSLFCYGIRMCCVSLIQNPWQLVIIESVMQGPTYALCYSTIVGYAAHVAPPGYSATVQGIVAGMDDGVGFALGSLVGGQLYGWAGGRGSFRVLAVTAGLASILHFILFRMVTRSKPVPPPTEAPEEGEKMLPIEQHNNAIYRDTVEPLTGKKGSR